MSRSFGAGDQKHRTLCTKCKTSIPLRPAPSPPLSLPTGPAGQSPRLEGDFRLEQSRVQAKAVRVMEQISLLHLAMVVSRFSVFDQLSFPPGVPEGREVGIARACRVIPTARRRLQVRTVAPPSKSCERFRVCISQWSFPGFLFLINFRSRRAFRKGERWGLRGRVA